MQFAPYNKKAFLLPDSIDSMAGYHAKLFPDGRYVFRIHDCITGIRLIGELRKEQDYNDAFEKLINLANACFDFANYIEKIKTEKFDAAPPQPAWWRDEQPRTTANPETLNLEPETGDREIYERYKRTFGPNNT